jgi:hypothetical protein
MGSLSETGSIGRKIWGAKFGKILHLAPRTYNAFLQSPPPFFSSSLTGR